MYLIKNIYTKLERSGEVIYETTGWIVLSFHTECNKATFKMPFKDLLLGSHNRGIHLVLEANFANL
jgi:hypothetical protein